MAKRYFSVDEANDLLPRLEETFGRLVRLRGQLRAVATELEALGEPLTERSVQRDGGPPDLVSARARARALIELVSEEMAQLEAIGVEVKDIDTGLCDFVARRDGRDVYLCWKLGEKQVGHWHELHTGFAGRQPLERATPRVLH